MDYIGEHLWAGYLGRFSVVLAAVSSLLAAYAYWKSEKNPSQTEWKSFAKKVFGVHIAAVFSIVGTLFFIMANHYFEFDYVWKHTSLDLPPRYLFSAFWEGQEGSFILWLFWHAVLGGILMYTAKKWEASTMIVVSLVQFFLATMVLGVYIGSLKIGQSPFVLVRELPENVGMPWTQMEDYLSMIPAFADGSGLNPLLQNYWMTIHPPTLFLGFASTLIPFAFAVAALAKKDFKSWVGPATPWAFFSVMILGTGILMGGAWAYEALSFGGFWAWDPVENSSLVPWLVMVGAAHLLLIEKNRGGALMASMVFTLLAFLLILYSTFLTRSGVLGDSSVHAFVDLGLSGQLLIYLLFFVVGSFALLFWRMGSFPKEKKDDALSSREFWMFIGQMVLLVSALQITSTTSIPVFNTLFGPEGAFPLKDKALAPPNDLIDHYNQIQVPFAIAITLLMGLAHFLRYKETPKKVFMKVMRSVTISLVLTIITVWGLGFMDEKGGLLHAILLFTGYFTVFGNLDYWLTIFKGKWRLLGPNLAHIGFGFIIVGALISNFKKQTISKSDVFIHKEFPANENLLIELNDTVKMGNYQVTWVGEERVGNHNLYQLDFFNRESKEPEFTLHPSILLNEQMGNNAEPSTLHRLTYDIYTHVTYADLRPEEERNAEWINESEIKLNTGDSVIYANSFLVLDSIAGTQKVDSTGSMDVTLAAMITQYRMDGQSFEAMPILSLINGEIGHQDIEMKEAGIKLRFEGVDNESKGIVIKAWEHTEEEPELIIVKAVIFPFINLLWLGCFLMAIGTIQAMYVRMKNS
ncbi:MAG: cytochrome c biogenesis protein CcsA [Schleiferiaceae bacterium]